MSTSPITIDRALRDPHLLGAALGDPASWSTWIVLLRAAFALPLSDNEREVFAAVAGNRAPPKRRVRELWAGPIGRRSGKSRMAGAIGTYIATLVDHSKRLAAGELGVVAIIAASREQARTVHGYVRGFLEASELLRGQIESIGQEEIRLKGNICIMVITNSYRVARGQTLLCVVGDEISFWRSEESALPDLETFRATLPSVLASGGLWVGISTGFRRQGLLFNKHRDHFGRDDDDVLCVSGPTELFNPLIDREAIRKASEDDPESAAAEWGGGFRTDLVGFLDDELIDAAVDRSRPLELPPRRDLYYRAYVDVSGGAVSGDAYCICIAHREDDVYHVDLVRGRSGPFEPVELTKEYAQLCREYRISTVTGDKYALEWVSSAWRNAGITYVRSELSASELYLESLPLWTRSQVSIPDHPVLLRELRLLERAPARLKREQVTHPKGVHDDHANVCCGALCGLAAYLGASAYADSLARAIADDGSPSATLAWEEQQRQARHDELMRIYGKPPSLAPPLDLVPENLRASFQRARQSAWEAQRRNRGGPNGQAS